MEKSWTFLHFSFAGERIGVGSEKKSAFVDHVSMGWVIVCIFFSPYQNTLPE